ncbi:MAG: PucR family transcriptional regulator [Candidatus Dormibacterales bacterium]
MTEAAADPPAHALTVREAMTFGGFEAARLLAGAAGLGRRVEWVRVMETPETARGLRPGDLLLTTLYPIKDDPEAQRALVTAVEEAGGAGIVVNPERYVGGLPAGMAEEAERVGLPLFTLVQHPPWTDLMAPLLERIINAEHSRLKRSLDIHRRFTELVLDGKGITEICKTLAGLLESAVSVEDASFHLLAHAGGGGDPHRKETIAQQGTPRRVLFDPAIQRVLREVETHRGPMMVPAFPHLGMDRGRIIAPITAANQVLGYISVMGHPPHNEQLAFMAVEQAALVLALALTKEREVAEVEVHVRGEFLEDLVQGTYGDEAAAQRRARHLGYPLAGRHLLMITDVDGFRDFHRASQVSEDAIQAIKREYLRRVAGVVRGFNSRALLAPRSDSVLALLPLPPESPESRWARSVAEHVKEAVHDWGPGFTVSVGFSAPVEMPGGAVGAAREVRAVLEALSRFGRRDQVVDAAELGLTGLLAAVSDERLDEFTRRHLGQLMDDPRRGAPLLETLKAYLEMGEQQAAARALGIHPNTLRYRLDRIREVTGLEPDEPETRLNLAVALRVQSLLGR